MDSMETIEAGVYSIGDALGCPDEAKVLWRRISGELDSVREAVKGLPRPKTLIITMRESHDLNTLYTAGQSSFVSELVDCAGGENIYADISTNYIEASKETIVMKAPEEIIEFHAGEKLDPDERAKYIADWDQLPTLPAVKNGRIHLILESHSMRPGPRVGEIAKILAKLLHPEAAIPTP
jgi:iron complex transport system substrate-binding protein